MVPPPALATPNNIAQLVSTRFEAARASGSLTFLESKASIIHYTGENGKKIPFQLRFSPTLANKPKPTKKDDDKPKINPFLNPPLELAVTAIGKHHTLLLNKFPVTPSHSILITNKDLPQTHPLSNLDIGAAYSVIRDYRENGQELYGFFNSGPESGASQPHRHVQFIPIASMRADLSEEQNNAWSAMVHDLREGQHTVRFAYVSTELKGDEHINDLHRKYRALLSQAQDLIEKHMNPDPDVGNVTERELPETEEVKFSYNAAFMDKLMVIFPRLASGADFEADGQKGFVEANGTVLVGTLLVKQRELYDKYRKEEEGQKLLERLLETISVPKQR